MNFSVLPFYKLIFKNVLWHLSHIIICQSLRILEFLKSDKYFFSSRTAFTLFDKTKRVEASNSPILINGRAGKTKRPLLPLCTCDFQLFFGLFSSISNKDFQELRALLAVLGLWRHYGPGRHCSRHFLVFLQCKHWIFGFWNESRAISWIFFNVGIYDRIKSLTSFMSFMAED